MCSRFGGCGRGAGAREQGSGVRGQGLGVRDFQSSRRASSPAATSALLLLLRSGSGSGIGRCFYSRFARVLLKVVELGLGVIDGFLFVGDLLFVLRASSLSHSAELRMRLPASAYMAAARS